MTQGSPPDVPEDLSFEEAVKRAAAKGKGWASVPNERRDYSWKFSAAVEAELAKIEALSETTSDDPPSS